MAGAFKRQWGLLSMHGVRRRWFLCTMLAELEISPVGLSTMTGSHDIGPVFPIKRNEYGASSLALVPSVV
jgi:hypothetical protein